MKTMEYQSIRDDCTYTIRTGQNAQENWDLIESSEPNDIWFHVDGESSCHVVLTMGDRKKLPHKSVLNYCAVLCKAGSKAKSNKNVTIIYTEIKNVKINKKDNPGSVTTSNTKPIKI